MLLQTNRSNWRCITNGLSSRIGGVCGVLFVIGIIVGLFFFNAPDSSASDAEVTKYLGDDGSLVGSIAGGYIWIVSALLFLGFLAAMYRKLRAAEGNDGTLSLVAAFGGLGWAFMVMVSATAFIAVPGGIKFGSMTPPAPDFVRMMDQVGFGALVVAGGLSAALFSAASSLIVMRHGGLPAWTAWLGFLATIALFFGALFLPVAVFLIWVLAVGIVMILSKGEPAVK